MAQPTGRSLEEANLGEHFWFHKDGTRLVQPIGER
jgi:hypothetical protein